MKQLLSLLAALVLACMPVVSLAEFDLSDIPSDDLIALRGQILTELRFRGNLVSFDVPIGVYVVGEDFPAGDYSIKCAGDFGSFLTVYQSSDLDDIVFYSAVYRDSSGIGKLTLAEGQCIEIMTEPLLFTTYTGLKINIDK